MSAKKAAKKAAGRQARPASKATSARRPAGKAQPAKKSTSRRTKPFAGLRRRNEHEWFEGVIGQPKAKKKVSFYLRNHLNVGARMPNILLEGNQGDGKSYLARMIARNMPDPSDPNRKHKKFCRVDGSAVKNLAILFNDICSKFANGDDYITIFVDEAHGLPDTVQNAFLSIMERVRSGITRYTYEDVDYIFDASKVTWIFATTESEKIFEPLRDRMLKVQLETYSPEQLGEIMELTIDNRVSFQGDTLADLTQYIRRNARDADRLAEAVVDLGIQHFGEEHLEYLIEELNLLPHGISEFELSILETLHGEGEMSLGHLASRIGKPRKAVQYQHEPYLLALGYMMIEGKRRITGTGIEFLRKLRGQKTF